MVARSMNGSQTQSILGNTRSTREARPFYVFTTIWLALFLIGIAAWPTVPPRFQSETQVILQGTQTGRGLGRMEERWSELRRNLQEGLVRSGGLGGSEFTWQVEPSSEPGRVIWNLTIAGGNPTVAGSRLSTWVDSILAWLDAESKQLAASDRTESAARSRSEIAPWVAWRSQPVLTRVAPGRGVTTSQVIILAALACVISGMFTTWTIKHTASPVTVAPTVLADQLDLPIWGVIGAESASRPNRSNPTSRSGGFTWHRFFLRCGEACIILACALTVLHSARSREARELFLSDPLTLFRAVVRPASPPPPVQELVLREYPATSARKSQAWPSREPTHKTSRCRHIISVNSVLPSKAA